MSKFHFRLLLVFTGLSVLTGCSSITVESGDQFEAVEFPDGSIAYLNQESSVQYDTDFNVRTVTISGEVYFEVEPGDTPFVVHSALGEVEVLGTEFNVNASEDELEVEVEEGEVSVKGEGEPSRIKKGQRAVIQVDHSEIQVGKASFTYRVWMRELRSYFKAAGKEFKRGSKVVKKESKELKKDISKELKKLNK